MPERGTRRLRIALATHAFSWEGAGGGEVMVRLLAEHLAGRGHEVYVLTSDPRATMRDASFALRKLRAPTALSVRGALRAVDPDVVDVHNMELSTQTILAARTAGVPVVATVNSAWAACLFADMYRPGHGICVTCSVEGVGDCFEHRPPEVIGRRVPALVGYAEVRRRLLILGLADRLVAHSNASLDLLKRNGLAASKIRVVPNLDDPTFHASPDPAGERVLYAGGLTFPKGADVLVDAFAIVTRERPAARLVIAGGGYARPALEERVRKLDLQERVEFKGYLPRAQLRDEYRHARVVAFPPRAEETFGRAILEAWGTGAPIVTTAISAHGELVRDGVNGLKVAPEDPKALADALLRVLADPALARRLAEAGRRELARFEPAHVAQQFVDVYREVARPR